MRGLSGARRAEMALDSSYSWATATLNRKFSMLPADGVQRLCGRPAAVRALPGQGPCGIWADRLRCLVDDVVNDTPHALDEASRACNAGLGPDHVALGRAVREHEPAGAVGTVVGDDVVGIDQVLLRLRHLLDGADDGRLARRGLGRLASVALALDRHLDRQQPGPALRFVRLVYHHALREQRGERLTQVLAAGMAGFTHRPIEEARVEQMQDRVLDAADVLVDGHPVVERGLVRRRLGIGSRKAREIPGAVDEGVHRVGFARGGLGACRAGHVPPGRMPIERIARHIEGRVLGQHHRQILRRHRDRAARRAMDDRDRAAPVALPRQAPIAQPEVDLRSAPPACLPAFPSRAAWPPRRRPPSGVRPSRNCELIISPSSRNGTPSWIFAMICCRRAASFGATTGMIGSP